MSAPLGPAQDAAQDAARAPGPGTADERVRADELVTAFTAAFGAAPEGVWAAPGRVNLIGEHLDYNGGQVLPMALPQTTLAAVRRRPDRVLRFVTTTLVGDEARWEGPLDEVGPGDRAPQGWAAYPAGVLWALERAGHPATGLDLAISSTVPFGAGLSSSAALEASVAIAVAELTGLPLDDAGRAELAAVCVRAENEVAGAPTGGMDQAAALRCLAGSALLLDTVDGSVEQVPLALAEDGLAVLVIDTKAEHRLVDGQYALRRSVCEDAARQLGVTHLAELARRPAAEREAALAQLTDPVRLKRARHVLTEVVRVDEAVALLRAGRAGEVGPQLDASHASLRDDYEVSSPELDVVTAAARTAGALGARMTGGGFGGSAVALVPVTALDSVRAAVLDASAAAGHPVPEFHVTTPSAGARRLR